MRPTLRSLLTAAVLATVAVVPAASGAQPAPPETVLQDDAMLLHGGDEGVHDAMARLRDLGVDRVRLTAGWSVIAPQPDAASGPKFDATDPAAYPAANWMNLDRAVREANAAGLKVMIDIAFWAPRWATQDPASAPNRLRTRIDPEKYAAFATAVARRYAGGYRPTPPKADEPPPPPAPDDNVFKQLLRGGPEKPPPPPAQPKPAEPLPAVDVFTIWNEPNHPGFIQPQWERRDGQWWPASADIYRAMVRSAYPAIKSAAPASTVLIGATSSGGSTEAGRSGVTPLRFIRALACVDEHWEPIRTGSCAGFTRLPGDGWSHHPYSLRTVPEADTIDKDKLQVAATPRLLSALRLLVREGRLAPGAKQLWQTEYGYETSPPDPQAVFGPEQQADLLARAEFIGTADPDVRSWPQFLLRDRPGTPAGPSLRPFGDWQTGLEDENGNPKPAYAAFSMPAVAVCRRDGGLKLLVWGRWRRVEGASAQVQRRIGGSWTDAGPRLDAGRPSAAVELTTAWRGGAPARLHWTAPGGRSADSRELEPVPCGTATARAARHRKRRHHPKRGGHHRKMRRKATAHRGVSSTKTADLRGTRGRR